MSASSVRPASARHKAPVVQVSPPVVNVPAPVVNVPAPVVNPVVHVHVEAPTKAAKSPVHPLAGCTVFGCVGLIVAPCGLSFVALLLTVSGWVITHHPAFMALWH